MNNTAWLSQEAQFHHSPSLQVSNLMEEHLGEWAAVLNVTARQWLILQCSFSVVAVAVSERSAQGGWSDRDGLSARVSQEQKCRKIWWGLKLFITSTLENCVFSVVMDLRPGQ